MPCSGPVEALTVIVDVPYDDSGDDDLTMVATTLVVAIPTAVTATPIAALIPIYNAETRDLE